MAWQLAQRLKRDFKIHHFLLEAPTEHKISKEMAKRLNRNLFIESKRVVVTGKHARRFKAGSKASIQKVKLAPKRHVLVGCLESKVYAFKKFFPKFLQYIADKESFARNFNKSLASAQLLLDSEPCMTKDFQGLVDKKGLFYHLDFDRCFRSSGRKFRVSNRTIVYGPCAKTLGKIEQYVRHALKLK